MVAKKEVAKHASVVIYGEDISSGSRYEKYVNKTELQPKIELGEMSIFKKLVDVFLKNDNKKPSELDSIVEKANKDFSIPGSFKSNEKAINSISMLDMQNSTKLKFNALSTQRKMTNISVSIEELENNRHLVKVGPCDLSGVGGHGIRERIIKEVVNRALKEKYGRETTLSFNTVNVSACVGVRGKLQMITPGSRNQMCGHMNAYVKTEAELKLTHWEPRKGPQSHFNDTICGLVTAVVTSQFEKGVRENHIMSSTDATRKILKNKGLVKIFDKFLDSAKDKLMNLFSDVRNLFSNAQNQAQNQAQMRTTLQQVRASNQVKVDDSSEKEESEKGVKLN